MSKSIFYIKNIKLEVLLYILIVILYLSSLSFSSLTNSFVFTILLGVYSVYLVKNFVFVFQNKYSLLLCIYLLLLVLLGFNNENYISYLYFDIVCFFSLLFFLLPYSHKKIDDFYFKVFPKIGVYINIISILFVVIFLFRNGFSISSVETGRNIEILDETKILSPKYLLYGSLFMYPLKVFLSNRKERFVYNLGFFLFLFFSLAMSSRGTMIVGLLVFILTYFHSKKILLGISLFFNKRFIGFILVCLIIGVGLFQIPSISSAIKFLISRFSEENLIVSSRSEEAIDILHNISFNEILFGKGLGAANKYWVFSQLPNGVNNAHYGWIFLILKGGLCFLVFIYSKIVLSIFRLYKNKQLTPYAIVLLCFLMLEFSHTNFNNFYNLSFLFICFGSCNLLKDKSLYA